MGTENVRIPCDDTSCYNNTRDYDGKRYCNRSMPISINSIHQCDHYDEKEDWMP